MIDLMLIVISVLIAICGLELFKAIFKPKHNFNVYLLKDGKSIVVATFPTFEEANRLIENMDDGHACNLRISIEREN